MVGGHYRRDTARRNPYGKKIVYLKLDRGYATVYGTRFRVRVACNKNRRFMSFGIGNAPREVLGIPAASVCNVRRVGIRVTPENDIDVQDDSSNSPVGPVIPTVRPYAS